MNISEKMVRKAQSLGCERYVHILKEPFEFNYDPWDEMTDEFSTALADRPDLKDIIRSQYGEEINLFIPISISTPEQVSRKGVILAIELWAEPSHKLFQGKWEEFKRVLYAGLYGVTEKLPPQKYARQTAFLHRCDMAEPIQFAFTFHYGDYSAFFDVLGRKDKLHNAKDIYVTYPFSFPNDLVVYPRKPEECWASNQNEARYLQYCIFTKNLLKKYLEEVTGMKMNIKWSIAEHMLKNNELARKHQEITNCQICKEIYSDEHNL